MQHADRMTTQRDPDSAWRRRCASCRSSRCRPQVVVPGLLDGDININRLADQLLVRGRQDALRVASRRTR